MTQTLVLSREFYTEQCTIGSLWLADDLVCYTLEDKVREPLPWWEGADMRPSAWKVKGATAIPRGAYMVRNTLSPRFRKVLPRLEAVPGFSGILIHKGNSAADTEGCILVGLQRDLPRHRIYNCQPALDAVMAIIEKEPTWIKIL